ncbi:MAG: hypothetical protein HYZ50_15270 [Deltaproteobacteria bacterium]|nr:hypothetical protein [Deltaproteobacteria bacterium]
MDLMHGFLAAGMVVMLISLGVIAWAAVKIAFSVAQVEETAKQIAEMSDRNERVTQSILQKVFAVHAPQA